MPNLAVIEIHDLDSQGRGVGRGNGGKVVFVDGALPGDTVEVELTVEKKSFDLGVLKKIVTPSPSRRKSPCPHSAWDLERSCGACPLIELKEEAQIGWKKSRIQRVGQKFSIPEQKVKFVESTNNFSYRNRSRMFLDNTRLGTRVRGGHEVIEVPHCQVLNSKCMDIYTSLSLKLKNKDVSSDFKRKESIEFDDEQSLEEVLSLKKRSFKQNHSVMNEVLKKSIKNRIEKNIEEKSEEKTEEQSSPIKGVLELFCGNGNFSELFISEGQHFFGFENCKNSIDKFKFRFKKFPLARVKLKDLFRSKILRSEIPFPVDTLFLDPPRSGFSKLGSLLKEFPEIQQVIYVSCNLSTMERDLYQIVDKGFKAQLLEAYDFFPQTPHFETLVWLSR